MTPVEKLIFGARSGDINDCKAVLERYPQLINGSILENRTPLYWFAKEHQLSSSKKNPKLLVLLELLDLLLSYGADPAIANSADGNTPLHLCVTANEFFVEKLSKKVDKTRIDVQNAKGETAFWLALKYGWIKHADILIQNGANINAASNEGWTPLHTCVWRNDKDYAIKLLELGAAIPKDDVCLWACNMSNTKSFIEECLAEIQRKEKQAIPTQEPALTYQQEASAMITPSDETKQSVKVEKPYFSI